VKPGIFKAATTLVMVLPYSDVARAPVILGSIPWVRNMRIGCRDASTSGSGGSMTDQLQDRLVRKMQQLHRS
jgi:hypothetical protein